MFFNTVPYFSEGIYKESKSKFISFVYQCSHKDDAKKLLEDCKKIHKSARHICWALSLFEGEFMDYSEDGEPLGTAGSAILNTVRSYGLFNVFIIVVRYFGGVKLGTKGLTNAYKQATLNALEKTEIIQEQSKILKKIYIKKDQSYTLLNLLKRYNLKFEIKNKDNNFYEIHIEIPDDIDENIKEKIDNFSSYILLNNQISQ